jgi:ubiquinone biosynthesis accessory factor UbiK
MGYMRATAAKEASLHRPGAMPGRRCLIAEHRLTLPPPAAKLSATRSLPMTFDPKSLDDLARRLAEAVPPGLAALKKDLEQNFKAVLQSGLTKLDLVTRQEFDIQSGVLRRSRERLEELEARIAALEGKKK